MLVCGVSALINININTNHSLSTACSLETDVRDIQSTCIRSSLYYLCLAVMYDSIFLREYKLTSVDHLTRCKSDP